MRKAYKSDLTDEQWEVIRPLLRSAKHGVGLARSICARWSTHFCKGYEYHTSSSENWVRISVIQRMLRRLKPDPNYRQPRFKYPKPEKKAA